MKSARICPKCGCVYADGRAECTDCGEYTRKAADEEIAAFEKSSAKKLKRISGTHPQMWQYIAAAALLLFSAGLFRLWSLAQMPPIEPLALGYVNVILVLHLLIPNLDSWQMLLELITRKRTKVQFTYDYRKLLAHLTVIVIFNILTVTVSLFRPDGLFIKLFT